MKLAVIIPVYNEVRTIAEIIKRVKAVPIDKEIIVVDDGSNDGTGEIIKQTAGLKFVQHKVNTGKGSAIRTGLELATAEVVIIQDADLEYDPKDYLKLIKPIEDCLCQVVYGSRNLSGNKSSKKIYKWGGFFLSYLSNFLYNIKITDEPTCYKMMKTDLLKSLELKAERFEFCPEVTAKLGKRKYKIIEVPISYNPRRHSAGKKIRPKDGLVAIWTLIKYKFID